MARHDPKRRFGTGVAILPGIAQAEAIGFVGDDLAQAVVAEP